MQTGNPYIAGSPLRDPEGFFGRRDIIDWVSAELSNIHTNALVLYGQRRVGKTTILLQLRHSLSSDKFLPIYFDLQDQAKLRLGEVLANLADSIGSRVNLSEHKPESFDDEGKYFRSVFLPDLYRVLDKESRPVFLLDEFDVLDQGDEGALENDVASRALFPLLRQVMDDDIRPAFVFVVGRRTEDLRVDFNQMFKTSLTKEVWVLDRLSAETLVRQAEVNGTLKFTQQSIDRILQLTKSHAYLTQLVCQRLWQRAYAGKPAGTPTINIDDITESIPDALEVGEQALIWLWNGLGPAEKIYAAVLAEISDEGKAISEDEVIKVLAEHAARARLRRREVELAPQDLITRHVLELTENREYIFAIELFRLWVKQKRSLKDVVDEIDKVDPLAQQLFELGQVYYKKHEWSDAVRFFNDALRQNPSHFRANLLLGETFLAMGQTEDAVRQLETAYSLDSYESQYPLARALIALAKEKEKNGLDQDALSSVERTLVVSPNERLAQDIKKSILERQGDNALKQGDLALALSAFEKAGNTEKIEQVSREYKIRELQTFEQEAESFTQKKDWKQAISIYEQLIEKAHDQKSKEIWQSGLAKCKEEEKLESLFTLGLGALTSGDWEQAKKTLSEVVYIRPDYVKDNKSAVKLLEQAVAGRRPVTVETVFQSRLFRIFGSVSLLVVIGYFVYSAVRGVATETQEPTQAVSTSNVASATPTVEITNTSQPTLTPIPSFSSFSLYDDFSSGSSSKPFDTMRWFDDSLGKQNINWKDGYLIFSGPSGSLWTRESEQWSVDEIGRLQADLRIDSVNGAYAFSRIGFATNISGKEWGTQCRVGSVDGKTSQIICDSNDSDLYISRTQSYPIELGKFYTVAIEIDPDASHIRYYVDGNKIGDYQPEEKDLLVKANYRFSIGLWTDSNTKAVGAVDNVKVGPTTPTKLFVTNFGGSGGVSVVDTSSNSIIATIIPGVITQGITSNPDGTVGYIADTSSNKVSVIDLVKNSLITNIPVDNRPIIPAISSSGDRLYVTGEVNFIAVIDIKTNSIINTISTGSAGAWGVAVNPDGSRIAATLFTEGAVSIYDTKTFKQLARISVGRFPEGVIYQPDGSKLYVANLADSSISVIDTSTNKVINTIKVGTKPGDNPVQFAFNADATKLYVANDVSDSVSEIDVATGEVVREIKVGTGPRDVAVVNQYLYVTNLTSKSISVVDLNTGEVIKTITGFSNPHSIVP